MRFVFRRQNAKAFLKKLLGVCLKQICGFGYVLLQGSLKRFSDFLDTGLEQLVRVEESGHTVSCRFKNADDDFT